MVFLLLDFFLGIFNTSGIFINRLFSAESNGSEDGLNITQLESLPELQARPERSSFNGRGLAPDFVDKFF